MASVSEEAEMPLYEYQCHKCGKRFERIQAVSAAPVTECPYCTGEVHRLLGVPALQFKGSGWYVTDYGKGKGRDDAAQAGSGDGAKDTPTPAATGDGPKPGK